MAIFPRQSTLCALVATLGVGGCGGSDGPSHVELSGKSPVAGSMQAAEAICRRKVACGSVQVSCGAGSTTATQCSATIVHSDYDHCFNDAQPSLEKFLACPALTAQGVDMIESCVDALVAEVCVTQEQADAAARAAQMNMSAPASPAPPECAFLNFPPQCE